MAQNKNVFDEAIANLKDGQYLVLEFGDGKQISISTRQTIEEVEKDLENWEGQVEYLEAEMTLLYKHIRKGDPLDFDSTTGRVRADVVVDYLIERSKDEVKPS